MARGLIYTVLYCLLGGIFVSAVACSCSTRHTAIGTGGDVAQSSTRPEPGAGSLQDLVRNIQQSGDFISVDGDNSRVIIHTDAIDAVVRAGPPALPLLLRELANEQVDFDRFVRCYSAAEQIVEPMGHRIYWSGNCRSGSSGGDLKFIPALEGQDAPEFRKRVSDSLAAVIASN